MNEIMDPELREQVLSQHIFRDVPVEAADSQSRCRCRQARCAARKFAPIFRFRLRPTSTAGCAPCRISPRFGATSIRSCFTGGTWVSRAISRSCWPSAIRKRLNCFTTLEEVKREAAAFMKVRAVWQFFEVERDGNTLSSVRARRQTPIESFHFGRQAKSDGLCLSDYVLDPQDGQARSHCACSSLPPAKALSNIRMKRKREANTSKRMRIQALAIETAEACAEWLHRRIREDWGFPDPPDMTMQERFTSRYRGKRYSFGYPACPNLEDQAKLMESVASRRYRRSADGRLHDGARSERIGACFPSPGLRLLQRRRRARAGFRVSSRRSTRFAPSFFG